MDLESEAKESGEFIFKSSGSPILKAGTELPKKTKTSLRMRYEAEKQVLRAQIGDLESLRNKLGLSRRKICQLLLVDPSAWTRWTREGGEAPPHIYRSLQWYMLLLEKGPQYHPQNSFIPGLRLAEATDSRKIKELEVKMDHRIQSLASADEKVKSYLDDTIHEVKTETSKIRENLLSREAISTGWKFLLLANTGLLVFLLLRGFLAA